MNEKRGYHVTVVDNKTGETVSDFDTRAIVYVMLNEIDEKKVNKEQNADMSCGIGTARIIDGIRLDEMLGITDGLQHLLQTITKENPVLEKIALLCKQRTIPLGDEDD